MCGKELAGGICAVDLEAFVFLARERFDETEIAKSRGDVKKFLVEAELLLTALLSREQKQRTEWLKSSSVECSRKTSVASFASKESGMTRAKETFDMFFVASFQIDHYRRFLAITDEHRPFRGRMASRAPHLPPPGRIKPMNGVD